MTHSWMNAKTYMPGSLSQCSARLHRVRSFATTSHCCKQQRAPAAYYRGGASRAIMFRSQDLPKDKSLWPHIFRSTIGSPDSHGRRLDGMGGGLSSLSKVCVIGPSEDSNADVDYTFAAIGVKNDEVDFSSNCGNMTGAVGPFAVDSGLVSRSENGSTSVAIRNTNTNKLIRATFEVEDGEAVADGDFAIEGVSGTASKIQLSFLDPAGAKTGRMLPTGNVTDMLDGIESTCVDVGNPCVFVRAEDLGVKGSMLAEEIEAHPTLLKALDGIRRKAAVAMGIVDDESKVPGSIPKIAMVSEPHIHKLGSGLTLGEESCDLVIRAISVGQPHKACPITVGLALATAAKLKGSTVQSCVSTSPVDNDGITLGHNSGRMLVGASFDEQGAVQEATVFSTARRLMDGTVYWK
ncbi:PrpF protein [Elsinoe ampelina]|uniref:PrpF protein n=1 Tax=Elsinoe ampelina TaxID=302913 RepID=A0A6A6G0G6_9PEZI|nr:PrpF protein [Elsinoe ampelina]